MSSFESKKKQNGIWKEVFSLQFVLVSPPPPCFLLVCVCCMGVSSSVPAPGRSPHLLTSISSAAATGSMVSHPLITGLFHQQLWYELSESFLFFPVLPLVYYSCISSASRSPVPAPRVSAVPCSRPLPDFGTLCLQPPACPSFSSATISVNIPIKSPSKHSCVSALLSKNKILLVNKGFFPPNLLPS